SAGGRTAGVRRTRSAIHRVGRGVSRTAASTPSPRASLPSTTSLGTTHPPGARATPPVPRTPAPSPTPLPPSLHRFRDPAVSFALTRSGGVCVHEQCQYVVAGPSASGLRSGRTGLVRVLGSARRQRRAGRCKRVRCSRGYGGRVRVRESSWYVVAAARAHLDKWSRWRRLWRVSRSRGHDSPGGGSKCRSDGRNLPLRGRRNVVGSAAGGS